MNYYGAKDIAAAFRTVRKNTIQIAEDIGEEHYGFRPAPPMRTVAQTLFHIAVTTRAAHQIHAVEHLSDIAKFDFMDFFGTLKVMEAQPRTKEQLLALLREEGDRFAGWLDTVTDEFLGEMVAMRQGMPSKSRFEMLLAPKEHEMHHRAQLMVVERMLGITPHMTREMEARIAAMQAAKA